jgi:hypothetical protein
LFFEEAGEYIYKRKETAKLEAQGVPFKRWVKSQVTGRMCLIVKIKNQLQ